MRSFTRSKLFSDLISKHAAVENLWSRHELLQSIS